MYGQTWKSLRRKAAAVLAGVLTLTLAAGCGGSGGGEKETAAGREMGRYVEEFQESGVALGRCGGLTRLEDGSLALFSYNYGPFLSRDEGKTWEAWQTDWYSQNMEGVSYQCAAIAPDGSMFLGYTVWDAAAFSEDGAEEESETQTEEDGREEDDEQAEDIISFEMLYQLVGPDGVKKELVPDGLSGKGEEPFIRGCWFAPDGTLYMAADETLFELNQDDGSYKTVLEAADKIAQVVFLGDDLIASTAEGAVILDRKENIQKDADPALDDFLREKAAANGTNQLLYSGGAYNVCLYGGEDMLYLVCDEGLYAHRPGGGTMEKLLEGSLYTLGDPSQSIYGMMKLEGLSFLVLYADATGLLTYDETVPTMPDKELWVYSMNKDDMVQQAVSRFQKEHQDVYVRYETGLTENSGQTKEDVIKNLNTQILAGKGPDVLILDDLPMESYGEKGMLCDLSGLLSEMEKEEQIFDNIAGAFRQGDKLYAIPGRFYIPVMIGPKEMVDQAADLEGLAQAVEKLRAQKANGSVMGGVMPYSTLNLLSLSSVPAWEKEDGSMDEAAIEQFLKAAKRIYEQEASGLTQDEIDLFQNMGYATGRGAKSSILKNDVWQLVDINAQKVFSESQALGLGYMKEIWSTQIMFSVKNQKDHMECGLLPGQAGKVFAPYSIMGISASTGEKELSEAFVRKFLSSDVSGGDGFYANRTAQEDLMFPQDVEPGEMFGSMVMTNGEGTVSEMDIFQLKEEEAAWLLDTIASLDTPYVPGGILESAVMETGEKVLKGELEIPAAMEEIKSRVRLAMAE